MWHLYRLLQNLVNFEEAQQTHELKNNSKSLSIKDQIQFFHQPITSFHQIKNSQNTNTLFISFIEESNWSIPNCKKTFQE